jgi:hypothetical protein
MAAQHQPVAQPSQSHPQETTKPIHKLGEKRETPIKKTGNYLFFVIA